MEIEEKIFDEFGFCTCGNPDIVIEEMYRILKNKNENDFIIIEQNSNDLLYMYVLDKHGYVEHYSSVYVSRPTEKGKKFIKEYEMKNKNVTKS